jgi:hypothetical protein
LLGFWRKQSQEIASDPALRPYGVVLCACHLLAFSFWQHSSLPAVLAQGTRVCWPFFEGSSVPTFQDLDLKESSVGPAPPAPPLTPPIPPATSTTPPMPAISGAGAPPAPPAAGMASPPPAAGPGVPASPPSPATPRTAFLLASSTQLAKHAQTTGNQTKTLT